MAQAHHKQNLALREFGALNTQAARQVIGDDEFSWLSEYMPIGHGNMKLVPGPSAAVATITVPNYTMFYWMSASINAANYVYCFFSDGSAYEVNTDTGAVVNFAPANTFSSFGVKAAQWKNERILIVDPQHGYFSYDRQTLIGYQNTIYSVTIDVAGAGFTSAPIIVPSYGNATFESTIGAANVNSVTAGGSGYQVGDILQIQGGTFTTAGTIRVTSVGASNAVTGAVVETPGAYSIAPTNPVNVTGGYGAGATFTMGFNLIDVTVTNRGSGYTSIPTMLINPSGTTGSEMLISQPGNYSVIPVPLTNVATSGGTGTGLTLDLIVGITDYYNMYQPAANTNPGYQIGDVFTIVGGTYTTPATFQITNIVTLPITGGYVLQYYYVKLDGGNYTVAPTLVPVVGFAGSTDYVYNTTGGHGSGLQVFADGGFLTWVTKVGIISAKVNTAGSGYTNNDVISVVGGTYITQPTVTYKSAGTGGGAILTANLALSISGTAIASYSGRVWMVTNSRTVVFSAPDSYEDFLTADGAGSFILSDEQMKSQITGLKSANGYLYVTGVTSVFIVSGVALTTSQAGSPTTTFNLSNLTTSFGTDLPQSMLPHYRSMLFGSDYGWYSLTGVTPQKISNPLDGFLNNVNLSDVTAGQCIIFGQLCECWLVQYTDPVTLVVIAVVLVYFNNKWFMSLQNSSLKMIAGSVYSEIPTLYGTDGSNIYRLFSDANTQRTFKLQTKMWDMGNPLITKQITRLGIETTVQAASLFDVSLDTEKGSTSVSMSATQAGYYFSRANAGTVGNYVGLTITGTATPGDVIHGLYMAYEAQTPWAKAQGG